MWHLQDKLMKLNQFWGNVLSIPTKNIRKPEVFFWCFQGVYEGNIENDLFQKQSNSKLREIC